MRRHLVSLASLLAFAAIAMGATVPPAAAADYAKFERPSHAPKKWSHKRVRAEPHYLVDQGPTYSGPNFSVPDLYYVKSGPLPHYPYVRSFYGEYFVAAPAPRYSPRVRARY
jgi:hypothetical protein